MIFYFHTERIIMIQPWTRNIPMERNKIIFWSFLDCSIEKIILISLDGSGFVSFKYNLKIWFESQIIFFLADFREDWIENWCWYVMWPPYTLAYICWNIRRRIWIEQIDFAINIIRNTSLLLVARWKCSSTRWWFYVWVNNG